VNAVVLTCHPTNIADVVHWVNSQVRFPEFGALALTFVLGGDIARLRVPSFESPRRADRLWEHTCFEAFVRAQGQAGYYEFNFSPSGEWAAYAFREYREGGPIDDDQLDPKIATQREAEMLELHAVVRLDRLSQLLPGSILRLGLSAVVEDINGRLSYWALKHPPGKPDFHHPDNFALEIPLGGQDP
jgi:hypothetical protein